MIYITSVTMLHVVSYLMVTTQNLAGGGVIRVIGFALWSLMAATPQDNVQTFLENIPNIISDSDFRASPPALRSNKISVIEFNIRRLEDSLYVINILHQRSVAINEIGDQQLRSNLAQLLFEVQRLCSEYGTASSFRITNLA